MQFNKRLPLGYMQIQLVRFGPAFQSALDLEQAGNGKWWIALITYALWRIASYSLTRMF